MNQVGGAQQGLNQARLGELANQFYAQRDYPMQAMQQYMGLLQPSLGFGTQTSKTPYETNPFMNIVGGGLGLYGLGSMTGAFDALGGMFGGGGISPGTMSMPYGPIYSPF
jgi:hypothetical protein